MFAFTPASLFIKTLFPVTNEASAFPYFNFKRVRFCRVKWWWIHTDSHHLYHHQIHQQTDWLTDYWRWAAFVVYVKFCHMSGMTVNFENIICYPEWVVLISLVWVWVLSFPWREGQLWEYNMLLSLIRRARFSCVASLVYIEGELG